METLIIGVGNPLRGDDRIGSEIVKDLIKMGYKNVIDCESTPENYLFKILELKPKKVIVLDACDFNGKPGEFRFFAKSDWEKLPLFSLSTHTLPLSLFLHLIEKECGCEVYLLGIQAKTIELSSKMSWELKRAKRKIINYLISQI